MLVVVMLGFRVAAGVGLAEVLLAFGARVVSKLLMSIWRVSTLALLFTLNTLLTCSYSLTEAKVSNLNDSGSLLSLFSISLAFSSATGLRVPPSEIILVPFRLIISAGAGVVWPSGPVEEGPAFSERTMVLFLGVKFWNKSKVLKLKP